MENSGGGLHPALAHHKKKEIEMARFLSSCRNLRVTCRPTRVNTIDGRAVMHAGYSAQFEGGSYTTDDPEQIKMLRAHPRFGLDYYQIPEKTEVQAEISPKPKKEAKPRKSRKK